MTYCCGILVRDGLVMIADTRTNAGLDNVSTFRKLHIFSKPGERIMAIASAGNLAISQSVLSTLTEGIEDPNTGEIETLMNAPTMFQAAQRIGRAIRLVHATEGPALRSDVAVAVSEIPRFIDRANAAVHSAMPGVRVVCFGHVGDGNLHFNVLPPPASHPAPDWAKPLYAVLYDVVHELGGSFSAEHGVGQAKRDELRRYKSEIEIAMMRSLKQAFDPLMLMNPGKIL